MTATHWKHCRCAASLLALAALACGCTTTYRTADERFLAQPAEHRRVQLLAVWLDGTARTDRTLSTNDLARLGAETGEQLCLGLQQALVDKGYELVGPPRLWTSPGTGPLPDSAAARPWEAVRQELSTSLLRDYLLRPTTPVTFWAWRDPTGCGPATNHWQRPKRGHNPFHCQFAPTLTNLLAQLGATNASAVLLVNTRAFYLSPRERTKAVVWNATAGAVLVATEVAINLAAAAGAQGSYQPIWVDPFWRRRNALHHTVALVDARSGQVLWVNRQDFDYKDPRRFQDLTNTLSATLSDLPRVAR